MISNSDGSVVDDKLPNSTIWNSVILWKGKGTFCLVHEFYKFYCKTKILLMNNLIFMSCILVRESRFNEAEFFPPQFCLIFKKYWNAHCKFHINSVLWQFKYFKEQYPYLQYHKHTCLWVRKRKRSEFYPLSLSWGTEWRQRNLLFSI